MISVPIPTRYVFFERTELEMKVQYLLTCITSKLPLLICDIFYVSILIRSRTFVLLDQDPVHNGPNPLLKI